MAQATNIRDEIAAQNEKFMDAFKQGDAAALARLYTEQGQVLPPNAGIVEGRDAIQAFWQALFDMGFKAAKLEITEAEGHGDTAIEISTYELHGEGGQVLDRGKYIIIWKRRDGEWKLHRDIFNSSMPIPTA